MSAVATADEPYEVNRRRMVVRSVVRHAAGERVLALDPMRPTEHVKFIAAAGSFRVGDPLTRIITVVPGDQR